ncbi:MAG: VCBS repeat-containing protein [Pirellulaceae bacterium]
MGLYSSQQIEVADMDQDQDMDVVLTTSLGIQLYKNDGTGGFVGGRVISASPSDGFKGLALADMNRDGWTDIVAGADLSESRFCERVSRNCSRTNWTES